MSLRDSISWVVQRTLLFYWVSQVLPRIEAAQADNNAQGQTLATDKLVDWDYAGLHLLNQIPLQDRLNYHELSILRRERQQWDPKRKVSFSQEQYENNEFRRLYNAVFSTKPPHLRTSEENYIQHVKDDFFRKQMEPSNPQTSRERYEWHVKKQQGSFFGGKYDFDTYLRGNFTARRRRSVDDEGLQPGNAETAKPLTEMKIKQQLKTPDVKRVKDKPFKTKTDNVKKGIRDLLQSMLGKSKNAKKAYLAVKGQEEKVKETKGEILERNEDMKHGVKTDEGKEDVPNTVEDRANNGNNVQSVVNSQSFRVRTNSNADSKRRIRSRRIKREKIYPYINPKPNINRSWDLDPRNPWNRNIRYKAHYKFFNAFYVDFFSRMGSDRLPSNETFVKIKPPPEFREGWDSKPISHYVNEMEKLHRQLSTNSDRTYGVPSKEIRRRERDKNHTAILKEEEKVWNRKLSAIRFQKKKKDINQAEYDRLVAEVELDKKIKYKLYRTRSTRHIVEKAVEKLGWAAEFVKSDLVRRKRDVGYDSEFEDSEDTQVRNDKMDVKTKEVKIRSKRIKRDIYERNEILENKLDNLKILQQKKLKYIDSKRLIRRRREISIHYYPPTRGVPYEPTYEPVSSYSPEKKRKLNKGRKPLDYEPIYRHNAVYDDESEVITTPTTKKPKKTTVLTSKEIKRREEALKMFEADFKMGVTQTHIMEAEFEKLRQERFNLSRAKRNVKSLVRGKRKKRYTLEELLKGPVKDERKTKLEAEVEAQKKIPGVKTISMEGVNNEAKRFHRVNSKGVQDVNIDRLGLNSLDDPEHPDNVRYDINAYHERKMLDEVAAFEKDYMSSLGIRERMHQDYKRILKAQTLGFIDRGAINRIELERAQQERAEFLKGLPTEPTERQTEAEFEALSSFESHPKDGKKKSAKQRLKEQIQELRDLRGRKL